MKAAGITLSTVGAGGGSNPFLEQLAKHGGGRFYAAANVGLDPRHLPQGDPAGRRPADRRGAVLPDPDRAARRSCAASRTASRSSSATTARRSSRRRRSCSSRRATTRSSRSGSTASGGPSPGRPTRPAAGPRTGSAGTGFSQFFSQLVGWTFPGEETGGIEASFETVGGQTRLHVESVEADGSPRDFYNTLASITGPGLQHRPGPARPGRAGRLRGEPRRDRRPARTRSGSRRCAPGAPALGRTVGLVEPVAAEYRLLGVNAAAPRRAARRDRRPRDRARRRTRGRTTCTLTSSFTELWPWLLVLALLLWPLDIALRRVSLGRRELVDARGWVGRRWRVARRRGAADGRGRGHARGARARRRERRARGPAAAARTRPIPAGDARTPSRYAARSPGRPRPPRRRCRRSSRRAARPRPRRLDADAGRDAAGGCRSRSPRRWIRWRGCAKRSGERGG